MENENIEDLYIFAKRYGVNMKPALELAGFDPNFASRWLKRWKKDGCSPDPAKLAKLRNSIITLAKQSGTYKPGSITHEVAGIREALNRIEAAAGDEV